MNFVNYLRISHIQTMYFEPMYLLSTSRSTFTSAHIPTLSFVCLFILVTCEGYFELLLYLYVFGYPVTCGQLTSNYHLPVAPQRWVLWAPCPPC